MRIITKNQFDLFIHLEWSKLKKSAPDKDIQCGLIFFQGWKWCGGEGSIESRTAGCWLLVAGRCSEALAFRFVEAERETIALGISWRWPNGLFPVDSRCFKGQQWERILQWNKLEEQERINLQIIQQFFRMELLVFEP